MALPGVQALTRRKTEPTADDVAKDTERMIEAALQNTEDPLFKDAMRAYWQASRARKAGAVVIELFTYDSIYERDDWVCQLCGEPILRDAPAGWKRGKSIDHWVPLSRGGDHTRSNCIAAHVGCNSRKMDMLPEEWIAFVGEH